MSSLKSFLPSRLGGMLACALLLPTWSTAVLADDADLDLLEQQAFKQAAALVEPSVVRIQTVGGLDRVGRVLTGTGPTTGVIVSSDGYIISSAFNFISKPASVLVTLPDGRRFPARMVATDRSKMLTLLKIEATGLKPAVAAPKSEIRVGQWALALGRTYDNAFPNMSVGIVSAVNRIWGKAIQTDAKVSPVNYGGPLVDVEGRVMGILVPLSIRGQGETAGVEWYDGGIGFAIPLEDIYASLERLKTGKDLKPGLMGITLKAGNPFSGKPIIDRVRYGSPAYEAGMKPGDVIVSIDEHPVANQTQVKHALGNKYAGDKISVSLQRGEQTLRVELVLAGELEPFESGFLGILPYRIPQGEEPGVPVRFVYPESPAAKAGLVVRDRIVRVDDVAITDSAGLADVVSRRRPGEKIALGYVHNGREMTAEITLASIPDEVPLDLRSPAIPPFAAEDRGEDFPPTGRITDRLEGSEHDYWAYVPDDYNPNYPHALLLWLHPAGDTMEATILNEWKTICQQRGIILVAPKAGRVEGWNPTDAESVKAIVERFQQTYTIDPRRIIAHGFGDGGRFALHLALKYRELFRGVAAVAAGLPQPPQENNPDQPLQFHFVCGDADTALRAVEASVNFLRRMKFPVSFTKIPQLGHKYPTALDVEEIGQWVDSLDRI